MCAHFCVFLVLALRHGWQIISSKKSFAVFAATATEKSEWMAHIRKCVNDLFSKSEERGACNVGWFGLRLEWVLPGKGEDREADRHVTCRQTYTQADR